MGAKNENNKMVKFIKVNDYWVETPVIYKMCTIKHLVWFFLSMILVEGMTSFDKAYFYGSLYEALDTTRCSKLVQLSCYKQCGSSFICSRRKCYCEKSDYEYKNNYSGLNIEPELFQENDAESNTFVDSTLRTNQKPALRHHIAHFCPNLEEGRKCIHSCMILGKPAFCGKDHVCYCGHKYDNLHPDKPATVEEAYTDFRDLYEKYFGPNIEKNNVSAYQE